MFENIDQFCIYVACSIEWLLFLSAQKLQGVAIYLIWMYSVGHTNTVNTMKFLSEKYPAIEYLCNSINGIEQKMAKLFSNQKFEPTYSPWVDVVWITADNNITEEYFDCSKEENLSSEYMHYNIAMAVSVKKSKDEHGIIMMKSGNKVHCNLLEQSTGKPGGEVVLSNARFLTIEYRHPSMTEALVIELDRSWFVSGNQLLSRVFVRRYLDYQSTPFCFDKNYTILLIDDNMNFLTMNSNQYVLLQENSYKIMEDSFDDDETSDDEDEDVDETSMEHEDDEDYIQDDEEDTDDDDETSMEDEDDEDYIQDDEEDIDDEDDEDDDDEDDEDEDEDEDEDDDDDDVYEDVINKIDSNYISEQ